MAAEVSDNPHNQSLAIGIQLGIVGIVLLWAMWIAHAFLFKSRSLAVWFARFKNNKQTAFGSEHAREVEKTGENAGDVVADEKPVLEGHMTFSPSQNKSSEIAFLTATRVECL